MRLNKGFTIIELLIVIVIIGILVAITAVSYTGITNGANTSKNQANARSVKQALLACYAKDSSLPTIGTTVATNRTSIDSCSSMTLPTGFDISSAAPTASNKTSIQVNTSNAANPVVSYWDFTKPDASAVTALN